MSENTEKKEQDWTMEEYIEKKCLRYSLDRLSDLTHQEFEKIGNKKFHQGLVVEKYMKYESLLLDLTKIAVEFYNLQQNKE